MQKIPAFLISLLLLGLVLSCNPTEPVEPNNTTGNAKIEFKHFVGTQSLILNTGNYTNALNEPYTVTMFNYFVSNIVLIKADGSRVVYPREQSYFLVEGDKSATQTLNLSNLPSGNYQAIEFVLGVDSAKNYAPAAEHVGVLDPGNGMYWTWNSGHIFWKLEGKSDSADNALNKYIYHIAGAGGVPGAPVANNVKTISVPFNGASLAISPTTTPELHLKVDVSKIFNANPPFSISTYSNVMTMGRESQTLAANAATMFSFMEIH